MNELNRDQIVRGLACCKGSYDCFTCDIYKRGCAGFREGLAKDALSLINELTVELNRKEIDYNELYELTTEEIKSLLDEKSRQSESIMDLHETCTELTRKLELANLEIECKERICESYMLQYGTVADKEVWLKKERADTVRKMQTALWANLSPYSNYTTAEVGSLIDQIAKEMVEGEYAKSDR